MFLFILATLPSFILAQDHGSPCIPPSITTAPAIPNQTPDLIPDGPYELPAPVDFQPDNISWAPWATPIPSQAPESSPGDIYICTGTSFSGTCAYLHDVTFQCHNLALHFQKQLTSIRPDKNQLCIFYDQLNWLGATEWMRWPGSGNMRGRRWDNRAVSWRCTENGCDGVRGPGGCSENADGSPKVWG